MEKRIPSLEEYIDSLKNPKPAETKTEEQPAETSTEQKPEPTEAPAAGSEPAVPEAKLIPVTKEDWEKMSDTDKENALLGAVKDPDDVDEFIDCNFDDLPAAVITSLYK
jgi:cell division septation protein DedD